MWISVGITLSYTKWTRYEKSCFVYKAFSRRERERVREREREREQQQNLPSWRTWRRYEIYKMKMTYVIKKVIITILLYLRFRFGFAHLQHSKVSNLNAVCALYYKVYCAYSPSNGAMALLNKMSVFHIAAFLSPLPLLLSPLFSSPSPSHWSFARW